MLLSDPDVYWAVFSCGPFEGPDTKAGNQRISVLHAEHTSLHGVDFKLRGGKEAMFHQNDRSHSETDSHRQTVSEFSFNLSQLFFRNMLFIRKGTPTINQVKEKNLAK